MLFNSLHFLLFFAIVTPTYFFLSQKFRVLFLLIASCYFYMAFLPVYILILAGTIVIDYIAGIYIEKTQGKKRKLYLVISLISNIGILCIFKYYNFLNENISHVLNVFGYENHIPNLSILLPIGLSFHTFQAMSYTIEVYRGNQPAERNFITYSLYVMFYPQLVAGPIERPQNLLYQFKQKHNFEYQRVVDGLKLMAWGMFKKVVIADRLAEMVNYVYNDPTSFKGFPLIIATVFFAIQIYCDFSGYSDIAIGSAQVMGFKLMRNFERPYFSKSISEFWKRWHISLSTWFKDYLYIPLGGNRVVKWKIFRNLLLTFLISGLWHGANWTFIIWGAIHGIYLVLELLLKPVKDRFFQKIKLNNENYFYRLFSALFTFSLVTFAWIFFRANSFKDAKHIITNFFIATKPQYRLLKAGDTESMHRFIYLGTTNMNFLIALSSITFLFIVEFLERKNNLRQSLTRSNPVIKWSCYSGIILLILYFGVFTKNIQFIYFQF